MAEVFYQNKVSDFIKQDINTIFGIMSRNDAFDTVSNQKIAWEEQIQILKRELSSYPDSDLIFEYTIPRVGGRIDNVLLYNGLVFVIEFKTRTDEYQNYAILQARTYGLDLANFHEESHNRFIIPILVATEAPKHNITVTTFRNKVMDVIFCNAYNIHHAIDTVCAKFWDIPINRDTWINSRYVPTPTIIEAAEILYSNHSVNDIARNDAAENLDLTADAVSKIIATSKEKHQKSIVFITGVPGAGKTLAGLNIAMENQKANGDDYACFLTGNQPLVEVLREALACDERNRLGTTLSDARDKVKSFIQIIHHFRDTALTNLNIPPIDHVVIFDEAQRAWHANKLSRFMQDKKKEILNKLPSSQRDNILAMSEPELLIEYMNRHQDWAVIVCLVGGGQDINDGEAGIQEWFKAVRNRFNNWNVYVSNQITTSEYVGDSSFTDLVQGVNYDSKEGLHLSVNIRSFRTEKVSGFVMALIDANKTLAQQIYKEISIVYPVVITRSLKKAKEWVKDRAGDSQARYGLIASSRARRLRTEGVWVEYNCKPSKWFLKNKDDIKSSYAMEEAATEFDIQGLEIDWAVVCWDADYRFTNGYFEYKDMSGSEWRNINNEDNRRYLKNAYRVLLTRARQGFVIFVPEGDNSDYTRQKAFYDGTYEYLRSIGLCEI